MTKYDAIIIGAGQAGAPLASYLANSGKKTLLVEKDRLGGTCVNTGCTPSKTLYEAARKIYHAQNATYAGFHIKESSFDFKALMGFVNDLAESSRQSMEEGFSKVENLTVWRGHASFLENKKIRVKQNDGGSNDVTAREIFINTGARPNIPDIEGLDNIEYYTSESIWKLKQLPEKMLIIGGGYIGLEFAQNFSRLGTKVTVVNHGDEILSGEDDDIREALQEKLEAEGIEFRMNTTPQKVEQEGKKITVHTKNGDFLHSEVVLIATGRKPNTDKLGIENTDLQLSEQNSIVVDEYLQTSVPDAYALGEAAGSPQFTHMSFDDFRIISAKLSAKETHSTKHRPTPYTLYTDPQLSSFGYNEKQAKDEGIDYDLYKMPMSSFARASEKNETSGLAKVLCDKDDGRILGACVVGVDSGELVATIQVAAKGGLKARDLQQFIFAHPLMAESLNNLFS